MKITCLNCGGKGYIAKLGFDGMKRPVQCRGCEGAGVQEMKVG